MGMLNFQAWVTGKVVEQILVTGTQARNWLEWKGDELRVEHVESGHLGLRRQQPVRERSGRNAESRLRGRWSWGRETPGSLSSAALSGLWSAAAIFPSTFYLLLPCDLHRWEQETVKSEPSILSDGV